MRKIISYVLVALIAASTPVLADLAILDGGGASKTLFNFVCFTTKLCQAQVLINSSGTEIATSGNPVRTDPTGTTTQPVAVASGAIASGAYSAGSFAAGALAAGAFATGAGVDGWDLTQGAKGDTAYAGSGSASVIALLKGLYVVAGNPLAAGTNGIGTVNPTTAANWGIGATGAAVPANGVYGTGLAASSEPSKATTGNLTGELLDLAGKQVTSPYANRENFLNCAVTLTASTTATTCTGMGAQGASVKIYVTDLACTRNDAGTTAATMTLDDTATTIIDMPNNGGGGGFSNHYNVPLQVAANTALTVQSGTSLSSVHCSASGFKGY